MRHITQLDLFSGIGGFHLGFERAGYKVTSFFSEVDKHAIAVYKHQFKDSTYVGSVTDVRGADLPSIDLITFGSPCQDFSLAGKRAGMEGQRSSLILEAIRLIHECRPRVFVWENVKGTFSSNNGADFWAIIQAFANIGGYRLEWQLLNTSWVLPQNRERIYLVGYSTAPERDWRGVFPVAADGGATDELQRHNPRANTITTRYTGNANGSFIGEHQQPAQEVKQVGNKLDSNGGTQPYQQDRVYDADGTTSQQLEMVQEPKGINKVTYGKHQQDCYYEIDGNMCSIPAGTHGSTPHLLKIKVKSATSDGYEQAEVGDSINLSNPNSETRRGRVGKQKAQTLETSCNQAVVESYRIRRLTPIECERLQGFPDDHTAFGNYDGEVKPMSNTQRYKQCGNAVTVDIVSLVAEQLKPIFDA
jgi:DNA (cytosine-5)-methyltransferase 1